MRLIFYIFLIIQLQNILGVLGQKEREKSSQLNPIKWEKVKEDLPRLKSVKWEKVKEDSPQLKSVKREKVEEKSEQLKKTIWKTYNNDKSYFEKDFLENKLEKSFILIKLGEIALCGFL